jgi:hypothetical protein
LNRRLGGVERGGSIDGVKVGVHILRCEDGRQFERRYAQDSRTGGRQGKERLSTRPRLLAVWEQLPVAFFAE